MYFRFVCWHGLASVEALTLQQVTFKYILVAF